MRRLLIPLTASVVGAVLVLPATAAPAKALCFQLKDPAGDARPFSDTAPAVVQANSLDVLSADIATGTKNLVATIRLKTLSPEPYLVGGSTYLFSFTLGGTAQEVYLKRSTSGAETAAYAPNGPDSAVSIPFYKDPGAATITWTVPRNRVAGLKRGAKISAMRVTAYMGTNFQDVSSGRGGTGFDFAAAGAKTYTDGTRTCLRGT
jgi:hypothetical protein